MFRCIEIQLCSLGYLLLLMGVFIVKNKHKQKTLESSIFKGLLYFTLLTLLIDIASNIAIYYSAPYVNFIGKSYLIFSLLWCFLMVLYVSNINSQKEYKTIIELIKKEFWVKIILFLNFIIAAIITYLKSDYIFDEIAFSTYQSGPALYFAILVCFAYMGYLALYLILNPKKISFAKRIPIFIFLFLALGAIFIQWINHSILLISSVASFFMLYLYFTMENPDLKIIDELAKDKEEIEEASKAKTDFLSNVSHDIRTPMNAIIGFSESLLIEDLTDFQKKEVENIYEAATTLLGIINNILDVSRIESGKEEKQEKKYELKKIIMQLTSVITAKIDANKIRFVINIDKNVPEFFIGDELKIYQILMNLLSNAVKYTDSGEIRFNISSENLADHAKIRFEVSDTGIGIKESDFNRLFVKFSRIHNQENYKTIEGTGLGLVITKKLVELLGGNISFKSEYGKGTSFFVEIPQVICRDYDGSETIKKVNTLTNIGNVHFDGSLYDVLIVDDNDLNLKVAQRILSDYKFQITTASSGEECLNLLKQGKRYDLIFLDHMMPIMDGIQTLKLIKATPNIKIPPIVALTANAMVGMKEMYLSEGFDGYISKPINREELQILLNNVFCKK